MLNKFVVKFVVKRINPAGDVDFRVSRITKFVIKNITIG